MAAPLTQEQLNKLDKDDLIQLFLKQQEQLIEIDRKQQLILEQLSDANRRRFGRSTEKLPVDGQIAFMEVDGKIAFFNETEAVADMTDTVESSEKRKDHPAKVKGKREEDIKGLPVTVVEHKMSEEALANYFGNEPYKQLEDEIYRRYRFIPSQVCVEEHHIATYAGRKSNKIVHAPHPAYLLRNSLVSPSLEAAIINGKYVNAVPLYRMEKEFERYGLVITRQNMANWTIQCSDRYLTHFYEYLHKKLYQYHIIQADETPVLVNKDGRNAGSKSYMWVYRTGAMEVKKPVVLYEYQKTRNVSHPREFLKDFSGVCVTDGYQVYHTIEKEREDLRIAGCWAHARRRFDEALKALPKGVRNQSVAYIALRQIQAIYREDGKLKDLPPDERKKQREAIIRPIVEAFFTWCRQNIGKVSHGSKTWEGFDYALNQEKYLKVFLEDGEVPMDNNASEQSIRSFCIGKKNWVMIDTLRGARASAVIYSIAETAKANGLKPYEYFKYLLEQIPEHGEFEDLSYMEDLLPWSDKLPAECRKNQ